MDFVGFLWLKFWVLVALAFVWGLYCGFTGRPLGGSGAITKLKRTGAKKPHSAALKRLQRKGRRRRRKKR